jgi:DNA-binding transcriptional LysR family regulator
MSTHPQPGLRSVPLGREELVFVLNGKHPLARRRTLEPADLAGLRFILYERRTAMQVLIENYFDSLGVTPRIAMEVENNEAIKSLVRAGLGASVLPLCAVTQEPADSHLRVLRVKGKPLMRDLQLLSADVDILPKAIDALSAALVSGLTGMQGRATVPSIASTDHS